MEGKENKKKKTWLNIIIIVLILLLIGGVIFTIYNKSLKENNQTNNTLNETVNNNEQDENTTNIIYIVKDENSKQKKSATHYDNVKNKDDILGQYQCNEPTWCTLIENMPVQNGPKYSFVGESSVLIYDSISGEQKIIKYNYVKNEIEDIYDHASISYDLKDENYAISLTKNDKDGIIGKDGNMIIDIEYDTVPSGPLSLYTTETIYSDWYGPKSLAVVEKNNLFGIIDVSNGKIVLEVKYDGVVISPNGYYSIKENDKWYLIDDKSNKIINKGYDGIFAYNDAILVLNKQEEKVYTKLIDYSGNNISNEIEVKDPSVFTIYNDDDTLELSFAHIGYNIEKDDIKFYAGIYEITFTYDKENKTLAITDKTPETND